MSDTKIVVETMVTRYKIMCDNIAKQLKSEILGSLEYRCLNALLKEYMLKVDILEDVLTDIDSGVMKIKEIGSPVIKVKEQKRSGKVCTFKGYDYKDLYGYDFSDNRYKELSIRVKTMITDLIVKKDCDTFITGGSLGFDKIVYYAVNALKKEYPNIKNCLAIPFKNQDSKWFANDLEDYTYMKEKADSVVYVDTVDGYNLAVGEVGKFTPKKLKVCHEYMIDKSDYLVALYRGDEKCGVSYCINYGKSKKLDGVYILNPDML